jgi:tetratricopeptide (TPR) repeat protein
LKSTVLTNLFCSRLILLNKLLEDGNTLYKKGRLEDASVRYTYAAKRVPLGPDSEHQAVFLQLRVHLLLNLSRCKRKQLDHGEAARLASEALSLMPSCPEALHARAKASHAAGRLDAALRDLTEAVRVAPQNRELHRILLGLKLEIKEKAKLQTESKDSRDSSSGVCSSGEGSTKDFEEVGTSL